MKGNIMNVKTITAGELLAIRETGTPVDLIDVRTPAEFQEIHAEGVHLMPLDRLDPQAVVRGRDADNAAPIYVLCRSGSRAKQACEKFNAAGFSNVIAVEGGTLAWEKAGGRIVRGKKTVSLERQVRITAGSLVLLGAVLALTVNFWFVLLSAFVAAGLVFAGITDTCGMGMLLARMPWNQAKRENPTCCAVVGATASHKKPA